MKIWKPLEHVLTHIPCDNRKWQVISWRGRFWVEVSSIS